MAVISLVAPSTPNTVGLLPLNIELSRSIVAKNKAGLILLPFAFSPSFLKYTVFEHYFSYFANTCFTVSTISVVVSLYFLNSLSGLPDSA